MRLAMGRLQTFFLLRMEERDWCLHDQKISVDLSEFCRLTVLAPVQEEPSQVFKNQMGSYRFAWGRGGG